MKKIIKIDTAQAEKLTAAITAAEGKARTRKITAADMIADNGEVLEGETASDAACAYGFADYPDKPRRVTYHVTRAGNIIFDYIRVLEV